MANLPESSSFPPGITQLETTDAVIGGPGGKSNEQATQLGNRTKYLKDHMDAAEGVIDTLSAEATSQDARIDLLEASNVQTLGMNQSKGYVTLSSGSPMAPSAADVGKLHTIDPNASVVTVRMPTLTGLAVGSKFFFFIFTTTATYLDCRVVFTSLDGSIIGDTDNFSVGDTLELQVKDSTHWLLIPHKKRRDSDEPGSIAYQSVSSPAPGWLAADGSAVSRTTYAKLFAKIGVTHGVGNGTTTFNLPDLRGVFVRGWDNGRGQDPGRVFGSLQTDDLKAHTHTLLRPQNVNDTDRGTGNYSAWSLDSVETATTSSVGGTETRPKNIALLAVIKY